MTRRFYQLFALAILIGAPLLISLMTSMLPGSSKPDAIEPASPAATELSEQSANPADDLPPAQPPPPPPNSQQQPAMQAGVAFDAAPSLDPSGAGVSGTDPTPVTDAGSDAAPVASPQLSSDFAPQNGQSDQARIAADAGHHHS